jgi:hypothetical protein
MTRRGVTLAAAAREFGRHRTPWALAGTAALALIARSTVADWQPTDALVPIVMLAVFPFAEWLIHVVILHWRPRRLAGVRLDPCWPASTAHTTSSRAM